MKTIILAGGFGTRFSEETEKIPKPMIKIGNDPILIHIMNIYAKYEYTDFYLALGYKADLIKKFFLDQKYVLKNSNNKSKKENSEICRMTNNYWNVSTVDTGIDTMTGGRVKRLKEYIGNETFMLTYGDGLADIDLNKLVKFHKDHKKMVTVTAVHPIARFGELQIEDNKVTSFKEKPQTMKDWINGGFFVINPEFFDFINSDETILEKEPLEMASEMNELMAFKHSGYWQCMDTKRDRDQLQDLLRNKEAKWI